MEQPPVGEGQQHFREEWRERREADEASWRLDRLAPLLHDLIAWDLVYRTEPGTFLLREEVQRRLEEASARQARSAVPEVYVGRPCQRCGATGVTRMVGGIRVCASCSQAPAVDETAHPEGIESASRRHWHHDRSRRNRKAG